MYVCIYNTQIILVAADGETLTTQRAVSGSIAAAHSDNTAVYKLSGTDIVNIGVSASDTLIASLQVYMYCIFVFVCM